MYVNGFLIGIRNLKDCYCLVDWNSDYENVLAKLVYDLVCS